MADQESCRPILGELCSSHYTRTHTHAHMEILPYLLQAVATGVPGAYSVGPIALHYTCKHHQVLEVPKMMQPPYDGGEGRGRLPPLQLSKELKGFPMPECLVHSEAALRSWSVGRLQGMQLMSGFRIWRAAITRLIILTGMQETFPVPLSNSIACSLTLQPITGTYTHTHTHTRMHTHVQTDYLMIFSSKVPLVISR